MIRCRDLPKCILTGCYCYQVDKGCNNDMLHTNTYVFTLNVPTLCFLKIPFGPFIPNSLYCLKCQHFGHGQNITCLLRSVISIARVTTVHNQVSTVEMGKMGSEGKNTEMAVISSGQEAGRESSTNSSDRFKKRLNNVSRLAKAFNFSQFERQWYGCIPSDTMKEGCVLFTVIWRRTYGKGSFR